MNILTIIIFLQTSSITQIGNKYMFQILADLKNIKKCNFVAL